MMNKVLMTALVTSVGFNFYFMNEEVIVDDQLEEEIIEVIDDSVSVAQSGLRSLQNEKNYRAIKPVESLDEIPEKNEKEKSDFDYVEYNEAMEKISHQWNEKISDLLEVKLGHTPDVTKRYQDLRNARFKAVDNFFKERTETDETYYLTLEDRIDLSKINEKYLGKLKSLFGADYSRYIELRNSYNKSMSNLNEVKYYTQIEF